MGATWPAISYLTAFPHSFTHSLTHSLTAFPKVKQVIRDTGDSGH